MTHLHTASSFSIQHATSSEDLNAIKTLFTAYAEWLGLDLSFQGFAEELTTLPGKYAVPSGQLLLARAIESGSPIGCVGLRPLPVAEGCCEMKRLYILPAGRRMGVGKALVLRLIDEAKALGYRAIRLDTLSTMESGIKLYRQLGFVDCERYYDTPLEGTVFLELNLTTRRG